MTTDAIQLEVLRRGEQLLVVPGVLCEVGFQSLDEVVVVDDGLARALERGERIARAATALRTDKDFATRTPLWKQAGCESNEQFVKGTTVVSIVRDDELTELFFMEASPDLSGFDGHEDPEALGPGTPLGVVAEHVLAMFAKHDR
ncbi:MAG TPA: hypothetical protein VGG74_35590 [Kofleriaceae bacterium]|jgi:hypothetical protein